MVDKSSSYSHMDTTWSWLILVFAWIADYLLAFIAAPAGILQVAIMEDMNLGSGPVSVMTSIAVGCCSLLGPVSGILSCLLSIRVTIFLGVILITIGYVCASFSYSLSALIFFYGILVGIGFGLSFSSHLVIVNFYFEKHRLFANGIILAASGIASLSIPFLVQYTIDQFGWRVTMIINAAIMLHVLVVSAFFSPTPYERKTMINWSKVCFSRSCDDDYEVTNKDDDKDVAFSEKKDSIHKNGVVSVDKSVVSIEKSVVSVDKSVVSVDKNEISVDKSQNNDKSGLSYIDSQNKNIKDILPDVAVIRAEYLTNSRKSISGIAKPDIIINSFFKQNGKKNPASSLSDLKYARYEKRDTNANTNHSMDCIHCQCVSQLNGETSEYLKSIKNQSSQQLKLPVRQAHQRQGLSTNFLWASAEFGSSIILPMRVEQLDSNDLEDNECYSVMFQIKRICKNKSIWVLCINLMFVPFLLFS